jgi:2-oxoglutarate ferredoxin oxidoreductase subunit beta
MTILLFNNQIYGLTKGQYSPTSRPGSVTKSTPLGSVDTPFNPVSLALGAEAGFVARVMESDRAELGEVLRAAAEHRGASLVEIYQNCPIFNDGAFEVLKDRSQQEARIVRLRAGEPVAVGPEADRRVLVRTPGGGMEFVAVGDEAGREVVVHDPTTEDPSQAFALSRLDSPEMTHVPMGIFRQVVRPTYDDVVRAQVTGAVEAAGGPATDDDLAELLRGRDTWTVG